MYYNSCTVSAHGRVSSVSSRWPVLSLSQYNTQPKISLAPTMEVEQEMTKSSLGVFVTERHGAPRLLVVRSTVVLLLVLCSKVVLLIHGAVI